MLSARHTTMYWLDHMASSTRITISIGLDFCTPCGIKPFAGGAASDRTPTVATNTRNTRCLEGVDLEALSVQKVDGESH